MLGAAHRGGITRVHWKHPSQRKRCTACGKEFILLNKREWCRRSEPGEADDCVLESFCCTSHRQMICFSSPPPSPYHHHHLSPSLLLDSSLAAPTHPGHLAPLSGLPLADAVTYSAKNVSATSENLISQRNRTPFKVSRGRGADGGLCLDGYRVLSNHNGNDT